MNFLSISCQQNAIVHGLILTILALFTKIAAAAGGCASSTEVFVNASSSQTLIDPFRTPVGLFSNGSGNWTWHLATTSYATTPGGNASGIEQALWLDISPSQ